MNKLTESFVFQDIAIAYHIYEPTHPNDILIAIAHGMAEHKERYDGLCRYLCDRGYLVVIHDHRGHGESVNEEHQPGDMGDDGFEKAVGDMHGLIEKMQMRYQPKRLVVLGHSMGSLIARRYLHRYGASLSGLILVGTPSNQATIGVAKVLTKLIMLVRGNKYQSPLLDKLSFGSFQKSFAYRTGFEWLNQDEMEVDKYVADERCGVTFSARAFYALFDGITAVFGNYPAPHDAQLPIIFLSGECDPCGEMGAGVKKSMMHLQRQGYHNVTMKLYPYMRHEILLEKDHQLVFSDIEAFLDQLNDKHGSQPNEEEVYS